jgi:diadenosine tetraphosphatase ApaH/serine/threonine PP2A family protein phosphatase
MRFLVISDIHANLCAFEAVLADSKGKWDKIWFLGDLIGYGPAPNECVELLRQHEHIALSGNHDWAVLDRLDVATFNDEARLAINWTRETLSEDNSAFLGELADKSVIDDFTLVHASPRHPIWEYILDDATAGANLEHFETPYCLVGHSHVPLIFIQTGEGKMEGFLPRYDRPLPLSGERLILNPGSVGQPRDQDPRAAYAILDDEAMTWEHRRVAYPVEETQDRMRQHDLPTRLIGRLEYGW